MSDKGSFGVALTRCYFCQEGDRILINKALTSFAAARVRALDGHTLDMEPCRKCADYMKQGVIVITVDSAKSAPNWNKEPMPNPYRTGGWFVVKDDAIKRMCNVLTNGDSIREFALKNRFLFIEHEAADKLGFFEAHKTKAEDTPS